MFWLINKKLFSVTHIYLDACNGIPERDLFEIAIFEKISRWQACEIYTAYKELIICWVTFPYFIM